MIFGAENVNIPVPGCSSLMSNTSSGNQLMVEALPVPEEKLNQVGSTNMTRIRTAIQVEVADLLMTGEVAATTTISTTTINPFTYPYRGRRAPARWNPGAVRSGGR